MHGPFLFFLFFVSLFSLFFLSFSLFKRFSTKRQHQNHTQKVPSLLGEEHRPKKKRKKRKKKRTQADDAANSGSGLQLESTCQYPFTSSSSVMQRNIKQQYDDLVKCDHLKKLTPTQMLETGACMENEKSSELGENRDDDFAEISFEELLAQEKKDSFWQKNGKSRLSSS